jgi:chitinase
LKAAPELVNGKLFVPLRTVAEAANLVVKWDNSLQAAIVEPANKVVAYYIEWGIYGRNFQVADIDASKVTHINYAFANIKDGEIALGDPWADIDKPFPGDCETAGCLKGNFNQLLKLKKAHPLLQTLISVGGWTWSGQFSDIAMTDASRNKFAESVVKFIRAYGFDGVDLDWEYPVAGGLDDNKRSPKDKQNYTLLLKTIRDKFDIAGKQDGKHYSITIAAGASPSYIQNTEPAKLANILDWINVMTYDFHGTWEAKSGQNAPLYYDPKDPDSSSKVFYADAAINGFLNAGVPAKQLVLGLPFYGHGWKQCAPDNGGQYQICNGAAPGTWESGSVDYYDLETNYINKNGYVRYWNDSTKTPYLYNAQNGTYISYDDAESFGYKVEYIQSKGLGGAMFWEITSDKNKTLLNKLSGSLIK